jgi:uncharacterized Zn-binding protein involved in type VI secretion
MGEPAARLEDLHVCEMHIGGPIGPPGCPTVLIGGAPAACAGDLATCDGPPNTILEGSETVLIGGRPAARIGDPTAHGGEIVTGYPTVLIGI